MDFERIWATFSGIISDVIKLFPISLSKINFAFGVYYQTPNYWKLMSPDNEQILDNSFTEQYVVGLEQYLNDDTRLTLEFYNKTYYKRLD